MNENYFTDTPLVGSCAICNEEIYLGDEAYYDVNSEVLLCSDILCLRKYALDYMEIRYGEVNRDGKVE